MRISDWSSDVCSSDLLAVVAALILAAVVQRLMLHAAVILDRAKRRSGQLKPFARGPHGIAARRALAFEHPGFLLLRRGRLPIGVETGMEIGRAHVCTPVTNAHLVCRLLLEKKNS